MNTDLYSIHDGELMLSKTGIAVLFGLPVEQVEEAYRRGATGERFYLPDEWMRRGRLRAKEAQAATGQTDMDSALAYWIAKEGIR